MKLKTLVLELVTVLAATIVILTIGVSSADQAKEHSKAMSPAHERMLKEFMDSNYITPKLPGRTFNERLAYLQTNHLKVDICTNDLLPDQVHVIGPNGKVYLTIHSDTVRSVPQPPPAFRATGDGSPPVNEF